jgi:hypothetical protein
MFWFHVEPPYTHEEIEAMSVDELRALAVGALEAPESDACERWSANHILEALDGRRDR